MEICGALLGMIDPVKFPIAIEKLAVRGLHALLCESSFFGWEGHLNGVRSHFVLAEDRLIFPVGSGVSESREGGDEKKRTHNEGRLGGFLCGER